MSTEVGYTILKQVSLNSHLVGPGIFRQYLLNGVVHSDKGSLRNLEICIMQVSCSTYVTRLLQQICTKISKNFSSVVLHVLPVTANALTAVIRVKSFAVFSTQSLSFSFIGRQMFREGILEFCNMRSTLRTCKTHKSHPKNPANPFLFIQIWIFLTHTTIRPLYFL